MVFSSTDWVYIIVLILTLGGLAFFIWNELRYKHKVIIREVINDRRIIDIDRAKDFKDETGVTYWKLKKEKNKDKKLIPTPPSESIELTNKGKKLIEVYRNEEGEYIFIKDENDKIKSLQPLTRNDRLTLIHSYKTAEFKNKKSMLEQIKQIATISGIIIIITMALIFMPDLINSYTKGASQISDSLSAYEDMRHDNFMEEIKQWEKISSGIQAVYNLEVNNSKRL